MPFEGDLDLKNGRWHVWHKMIGAGHEGQWVYSEPVHDYLVNTLDARRVEGSGQNMKLYAGAGDDSVVMDFRDPASFQEYAQLYSTYVQKGDQNLSQPAGEQGAPVNLQNLWGRIFPGVPFPDLKNVHPYTGMSVPNTTDVNRVSEVIRALESRVGDLSQYGINTNASHQVIPLGDQYDSDIVISDGKVTKIGKTSTATKPTYTPGLSGIGADLKGYDVLQQRSGELDPVKQRVDPGYIIDPKTMQPYFQQPDGSLQAAPVPSIYDQISMHLVDGNMNAAVNKANFRDRPTSLEYFNAAMEWARSPADIFTISALVRGIFEPTPGPMGQMRRVGAPPAWAAQAWVGLQNSMGIPAESMTSKPGDEPGTVNEMMVASSSGLVPTNFTSANSAPTTLDGGKTVTPSPTAPITGDSTVQATRDGVVVGSMTADMANDQGFSYAGQGGNTDTSSAFSAIVPTETTTTTTTPTPIPEPTPGGDPTTQFGGSRYEGSLNQKLDGIIAQGAIKQSDNTFLNPNTGQRWDSGGNEISGGSGAAPLATQVMDAIRAWEAANPGMSMRDMPGFIEASAGGVEGQLAWLNTDANWPDRMDAINLEADIADESVDTSTAEERLLDSQRAFIEAFKDRDRGSEDVGESAEDRAARYQAIADKALSDWESKQADIGVPFRGDTATPAWMAGEEGIGIEGARSGPGPASSFARAVSGYQPTAQEIAASSPIDYDSEGGGYGSEQAINASWLANMIDVPGEGLTSRSQLNDPAYWERVGADYMADPVNARTFQQVVDRQAAMDYATQFPQGRYLDEYPYTFIPGSKPDVAARDLTPAGTQTFSRPRVFDPATGTYRTQTIEDATRQVGGSLSGQDMRERNLGDLATTSRTAPGPANIVPTPVPQPSTITPEERRWATEAFDLDPWAGGMDFIPDEVIEVEQPGFLDRVAPVIPFYSPTTAGEGQVEFNVPQTPIGVGAPVPIDPDDYAGRYYDEGANGIRTRERMSLVGESGPELALFPNGTEIIPLDRRMQPDQERRLRRRGAFANSIDSFEFGGYVGGMGPRVSDLPASAQTMPAGITEIMSGRPTRAPRSLMRQAGMRAPSAQTISNLLPEEIGVYQEMGRLAGIPDKAFEREFRSMVPMGQGGTRQARFTPRSTGRTRYGSI